MKDDIKQTRAFNAEKDTNIGLLKYQLVSAKRDARKNILIACLIIAIVAFASGYILSDVSRGEVNALQTANNSLRIENERLKASTPSENQ